LTARCMGQAGIGEILGESPVVGEQFIGVGPERCVAVHLLIMAVGGLVCEP